ncbi:hypothetical protein B0T18DRAFT_395359 [Schizothecium vesticola]|uniref:Uncharacterized protein n=1 Tax=Schizothecium vesticola TaxID=314040 RepID=A0AA40F7R7_9PEZI|nr:hypothetical protein B0T18DRAFT_395359 [Schizothecium vesticola]
MGAWCLVWQDTWSKFLWGGGIMNGISGLWFLRPLNLEQTQETWSRSYRREQSHFHGYIGILSLYRYIGSNSALCGLISVP